MLNHLNINGFDVRFIVSFFSYNFKIKNMYFEKNVLIVLIICFSLLSMGTSLECLQGERYNDQNDLRKVTCPSDSSYLCYRTDYSLSNGSSKSSLFF